MPRYLAINYHKELFQESRNLLQKILIPLPSVEENKISAPDFSCTGKLTAKTSFTHTILSFH